MNIPLSLLIYNPIEAYTLILLCDIITGNNTKFTPKKILHLWYFGATNLLIQLIPFVWYGKWFFAILNIAINYIMIPASIMYHYKAISDTFSLLIDKYNMFFPISILHEFITNMVIFFVQVILYSIIKYRRFLYEKRFKDYRK